MLQRIGFTTLAVALLLPLVAPSEGGEIPALAKRCNAVAWAANEFDTPPALAKIQAGLSSEGQASLDAIEESLPHSLNLRRIVSSVVADWPCDRTRALLLRLLADEEPMVAQGAAFYLGSVGGSEVHDALLVAAKDGGGMVRHNALNALSQLGLAHYACDVAIECLADRNDWVRDSAVSLLEDVSVDSFLDRTIPAVRAMVAKERSPGAKATAERTLRVLLARRGA